MQQERVALESLKSVSDEPYMTLDAEPYTLTAWNQISSSVRHQLQPLRQPQRKPQSQRAGTESKRQNQRPSFSIETVYVCLVNDSREGQPGFRGQVVRRRSKQQRAYTCQHEEDSMAELYQRLKVYRKQQLGMPLQVSQKPTNKVLLNKACDYFTIIRQPRTWANPRCALPALPRDTNLGFSGLRVQPK